MRFGVREICDVVLRAKAAQKVGNKIFYKNEPVIYFDSLKTSSLEGASTTVYAQGGRGNSRLVAWEGERTVTFTMEDALISPIGFMILSGAGLTDATTEKPIIVHTTEQTDEVYPHVAEGSIDYIDVYLAQKPYLPSTTTTVSEVTTTTITNAKNENDYIYVMLMKDGEIVSEPYIAAEVATVFDEVTGKANKYKVTLYATETAAAGSDDTIRHNSFAGWSQVNKENVVFVDYYTEKQSGAFQIDITPDKFGGNYYLEASTLFRDTNGVDMPAEFIIPNCKIQSNFTFTMASSGDPSTFTFTMDAFPDYTRFDKSKKVLAAIQVINTSDTLRDYERLGTDHAYGWTNASGTTATAEATAQRNFFEYENRGTY